MDAQTLGALANIVNEAIAKAVGPLQAKVTELEGRLVHSAYDDSALMRGFNDLAKGMTESREIILSIQRQEPYDDAGLIARVAKQLEALREEIPAAYDDAGIRRELDALKAVEPPKPYDDTTLRKDLDQGLRRLAESIPAAYDDAGIKGALAEAEKRVIASRSKEVEALLGRIKDARYDDTEVRRTLEQVVETQRLTAEAVAGMKDRVKSLEGRPEPTTPRDGTDGRDALHLEVLPAIDEQKSYQRGTYAKHAGGLWRSFEQTSGLRGWECIVNGVKSVDARWDGKTLIETTTLSDGTVSEARKFFPVAVYKGVFDGGEYVEGDTATWAGSLWNCNATATKAKPGDGSTDWTLAVKKGRDGKEVVSVSRGEPQPVRLSSLLKFAEQLGRE